MFFCAAAKAFDPSNGKDIRSFKSPGQLGKEGEAAATAVTGVGKNTRKFDVNGRKRIPDQVIASNINTGHPLIVAEVKNFKKQSLTSSIKR